MKSVDLLPLMAVLSLAHKSQIFTIFTQCLKSLELTFSALLNLGLQLFYVTGESGRPTQFFIIFAFTHKVLQNIVQITLTSILKNPKSIILRGKSHYPESWVHYPEITLKPQPSVVPWIGKAGCLSRIWVGKTGVFSYPVLSAGSVRP